MLTIYKASAGSGKTFTLAYEYIKLLLGIKEPGSNRYKLNHPKYFPSAKGFIPHRHRGILAITFTNKATEEMKSRIVKELTKLAEAASTPYPEKHSLYVPRLKEDFGCSVDELSESARVALDSLLYDYHYFNVSTIDSFFQLVLRQFARELDRPGDFEVDLDDTYTIEAGIDLLFDDFNFGIVGDNGRIGNLLFEHMKDNLEAGTDFNLLNRSGSIHRDIVNFAKEITKETFKAHSKKLRDYFKRSNEENLLPRYAKSLRLKKESLSEEMKSRTEQFFTDLANAGMNPDALNSTLKTRLEKFFSVGEVMTASKYKEDLKTATIADVLSGEISAPKNYMTAAEAKKQPREVFLIIKKGFKDLYGIVLKNVLLTELQVSVRHLSLLAYAWNYVERFRKENNLVMLSDTNDLLQRIIDKSETPFIYERLGLELHHFLIDEFQDTSKMQWQNLRPLLANSLDDDKDSLIIGDEKQSIYRFRNSDSSLLHRVVATEDFPDKHCVKGKNLVENTNYRSSPLVVLFNNTLFSHLSQNLNVEGFENVIQAVGEPNAPLSGYIRFETYKKNADDPDRPLREMALHMLRQHNEGSYCWGDMAVLVNRRAEGDAVVNYLLKNYPEIAVMSDESLLLTGSNAVNTVISVLKIIDKLYMADKATPQGNPAYAHNAEIAYMINRFEYYHSRGIDCEEALQKSLNPLISSIDAEVFNPGLLAQIKSILRCNPTNLAALVEVIINETLSSAERDGDFTYLTALQDVVIDFIATSAGDLHTFLGWWDSKCDKLAVPGSPSQDAVKVMTIHKSKGLEFDCVHIPFGNWDISSRDEFLWIPTPKIAGVEDFTAPPVVRISNNKLLCESDPELAGPIEENIRAQLSDTLNKTYVAFTRPVRELIVQFNTATTGLADAVLEAFTSDECHVADAEKANFVVRLNEHFNPTDEIFEMGSPTKKYDDNSDENPKKKPASDDKNSIDVHYDVYYRQDMSQITQVSGAQRTLDDILKSLGDSVNVETDEDAVADDVPLLVAEITDKTPAEKEAARRGIILHDVFSHLKTFDQLDKALTLTKRDMRLTPDERDELEATMHSIIKTGLQKFTKVNHWFNDFADILNEQSIYDPERDETLRPDRIVVRPDGSVEVVDFKFTATTTHPEHRLQVLSYVNLLRKMGYDRVSGYLWYPLLETIVKA